MMVSLMSCGNSGRQNTESMKSTVVDEGSSNFIENDYLTATLPEGWEETHVYDRGFSACIKNEDGNGDKIGLRFEAFDTNFDLEGWVKDMKMEGNITDKIDDVSIGGILSSNMPTNVQVCPISTSFPTPRKVCIDLNWLSSTKSRRTTPA